MKIYGLYLVNQLKIYAFLMDVALKELLTLLIKKKIKCITIIQSV